MAHVLLIDDNEDFRSMLQRHLELEGYEVTAAPDGSRALELLAHRAADAIVTDVFMPETDGIETIVELRRRLPDCPVVAISGWQTPHGPDYLAVAREIGAVRTLRKPFELCELVQILRELTGA